MAEIFHYYDEGIKKKKTMKTKCKKDDPKVPKNPRYEFSNASENQRRKRNCVNLKR